jgi:hypothetical protein
MRKSTVLFTLATALSLGNLAPARSEPVPAPKGELKDYHGTGFIQLEIPTAEAPPDAVERPIPYTAWFAFRQGYVRPDRMLMVLNVGGAIQHMLISGESESIYNPSAGYVVRRTYRNVDTSQPSPMYSAQLSMATYARVLREITTGKVLPDEDLTALKATATQRIDELKKLRELLLQNKNPKDLDRANAAAAELARWNDELNAQIPIRTANPCHVIQFENRDVMRSLFSRGLIGDTTTEFLTRGKTTVWITKTEGLPVKIETTSNDGRVAIYFAFRDLKINQGLHPNELGVGAPLGTRRIEAIADMKDRAWQDKLDKELARQVDLYERERQRAQPPRRRPTPKTKG